MEAEKSSQSRPVKAQSSPWLVFFYESEEGKHQTFFSLAEGRSHVRNIKRMQNDICWPTPQGWILMIHPYNRYSYLFDPITMVTKSLPPPPLKRYSGEYLICTLSSSPINRNCKVLCANLDKGCLFFCQPGDREWIPYKYDLGDDNLANIVTCDGKFYGVTEQENFVVIDCPPHPRINVLEPLNIHWPIGLSKYKAYLVESCGEMFSVRRLYGGWHSGKTRHISIFKRDSSKQAWDMVDNVSGRVILLGFDDFSASCSASELGVKGNCVYFVNESDRCLYCFDLEEGFISVHLPRHSGGSEGLSPIWIMPAL